MSLTLSTTPEPELTTTEATKTPEHQQVLAAMHEQLKNLFNSINPTVPDRLQARTNLFEAMATNPTKYPVGANSGFDKVQTA